MKLLRTIACPYCKAPLKVPTKGSYRIQCGACKQSATLFPGPGSAKEQLERLKPGTVRKQPKETVTVSAPKPTSLLKLIPPVPPPRPWPVETEVKPAPEWDSKMLKKELVAIAEEMGLDVSSKNTKAEILAALEETEG